MSKPFSRHEHMHAQGRGFRLPASAVENPRSCAFGAAYIGDTAS